MIFDTHAHLNFRAFDEDREEVIRRTQKEAFVINVGAQYSTSVKAVEIAEKEENMWASVGLHPLHLHRQILEYQDDDELPPEEIKTGDETFEYDKYKKLAQEKKVVAIGEVGLDYHHFPEDIDEEPLIKRQKNTFIKAIKLAEELKKPLIVHCWDAYSDLYEILTKFPLEKRGVIHSFVGGYKTANKFISLGFRIGLNGVITYSESFNRLIKEIDLKHILLETDCPYLAPVPKKGERNEPLYVIEVSKKIGEIKGLTVEEVTEITCNNALSLFDIR